MRLRNMTSVYILHEDRILLMRRVGSRIFTRPMWCGIGGHFEPGEMDDPEACALRELNEETGIGGSDIDRLRLRYVTTRRKDDEIRQQYIFFTCLRKSDLILPPCDEGILHWFALSETKGLEMSVSNRACLDHYVSDGRTTDLVYAASVGVADGRPTVRFTALEAFATDY